MGPRNAPAGRAADGLAAVLARVRLAPPKTQLGSEACADSSCLPRVDLRPYVAGPGDSRPSAPPHGHVAAETLREQQGETALREVSGSTADGAPVEGADERVGGREVGRVAHLPVK